MFNVLHSSGETAKRLFLLAPLLLLTACNSEPSQTDIEQAVRNQVKESNRKNHNAASGLGNFIQAEVRGVRKIGCQKSTEASGYNCDFEIDATTSMFGRVKSTGNSRFVKSDAGWQVVADQ